MLTNMYKLEGSDLEPKALTDSQRAAMADAEAERHQAINAVADRICSRVSTFRAFWEDEDGKETATFADVAAELGNASLKSCKKFLAGEKL